MTSYNEHGNEKYGTTTAKHITRENEDGKDVMWLLKL